MKAVHTQGARIPGPHADCPGSLVCPTCQADVAAAEMLMPMALVLKMPSPVTAEAIAERFDMPIWAAKFRLESMAQVLIERLADAD